MNTTSVAQSVNRQYVGQALRQMRYDCQHNPREIAAINRASLNLEACTWYLQGERLVIESATQLQKRYHVDEAGCDCKAAQAGRPCWHLAAWHLIQRASRIAAATQPRTPKYSAEDLAHIHAEAAELV